jgi:hypothetical protein
MTTLMSDLFRATYSLKLDRAPPPPTIAMRACNDIRNIVATS